MNVKILYITVFLFCFESIQSYDVPHIPSMEFLRDTRLDKVIFYSKKSIDDPHPIERSGILLRRPNARGTIVVCHGFMCNKYDVGFIRFLFPDFNVLTFDFRAHGEHVLLEHCCTFGRDEAHEVAAAVYYLRTIEEIRNKPIIAYGFSMGAVAAILAQAADPSLFSAMILDCPYDDSEAVIYRTLERMTLSFFGYTFHLPGRFILRRFAFNPFVQWFLKTLLKTVASMDATAINTYIYPVQPMHESRKITVPCFFIHCVNDEKVPVEAVKSVYNGVQAFKRFWLTPGRRHFDSFFYQPEEYCARINDFILTVLQKTYHALPSELFIDTTIL